MRTARFTPGVGTSDRSWKDVYEWQVGDRPATLWTDGLYYAATIIGVHPGAYDVRFDDGVTTRVRAEKLADMREINAAAGPVPVPSQTPRRKRRGKGKTVCFEEDLIRPAPAAIEEEGDEDPGAVPEAPAFEAAALETDAADQAVVDLEQVVLLARRGAERARRISEGQAPNADGDAETEAPDGAAPRERVEGGGSPTPSIGADGGGSTAPEDVTEARAFVNITLRRDVVVDDDDDDDDVDETSIAAPPSPPGLPLCMDAVNLLPKTPCLDKVLNACKRLQESQSVPSSPEASDGCSPDTKRACLEDANFVESHTQIRIAALKAVEVAATNKAAFEALFS